MQYVSPSFKGPDNPVALTRDWAKKQWRKYCDYDPEKPHKKAVRTELRAMKDDLVEFILGPDYADRYPSATFLDVVVAAVAQVVERGFLTVAPKGAPFEQGRACLIAVNPNYATPAVPDPHATPHVRQ